MKKEDRYIKEMVDILDREYDQAEEDGILKRCEKCGNLGVPELEKVVRGKDWVIGLALMPVGGLGVFYLLDRWFSATVIPNKRKFICPICGKPYPGQKLSYMDEMKGYFSGLKNLGKAVATDKELQKDLGELGKSVKDVTNTL